MVSPKTQSWLALSPTHNRRQIDWLAGLGKLLAGWLSVVASPHLSYPFLFTSPFILSLLGIMTRDDEKKPSAR
jgi:hypothetical protein